MFNNVGEFLSKLAVDIRNHLRRVEKTDPLYSGLLTNNPQGPGFVMGDYSREQAVASVGPGWADIIGDLWDYLKSQEPPITINQVKEKYGALRCYTGGVAREVADAVYARINVAEAASLRTCETCGQPGTLRGPGWYFTACDEHSRGRVAVVEEGK